MSVTINEILLRRKNKLDLIEISSIYKGECLHSWDIPYNPKSAEILRMIAKNLEAYGYTLSRKAISLLRNYTSDMLKEFYFDLYAKLPLKRSDITVPYPTLEITNNDNIMADWFNLIKEYDNHIESSIDSPYPVLDSYVYTVLDAGTYTDLIDVYNKLTSKTNEFFIEDILDIINIHKNYKGDIQKIYDMPNKEVKSIILKMLNIV